jgi:hypothetical protein
MLELFHHREACGGISADKMPKAFLPGMNLIGSVAQRLQQKENKVSFLIRSAALLASIRATGEMNNLPHSNPQRSATKKQQAVHLWGWPTKFLGHRTRFFIWSPATAHPVEARPRRDNCRSAQTCCAFGAFAALPQPERNRKRT